MGNTPSTPPAKKTSVKKETTNIAPCDLECQKKKDLALLRTAYEKASDTQDEDPVGYQKARVAYFTLLNGPGWLAEEKARIAKQDVEPILTDYRTRYTAAKGERQSMNMFTKLMEGLEAQEQGDEADNAFFREQMMKEKDKASTLERIAELGANTPTATQSVSYYISYLIDFLIVILALGVAYLAYTRFTKSSAPLLPSVTPNVT